MRIANLALPRDREVCAAALLLDLSRRVPAVVQREVLITKSIRVLASYRSCNIASVLYNASSFGLVRVGLREAFVLLRMPQPTHTMFDKTLCIDHDSWC